jgi:hypothetical protein
MTLQENTEAIREWTDKLKQSTADNRRECVDTLNELWLARASSLLDGDPPHYRGYAAGMAEGYRIMLYMLDDTLEEM